MNLMELIDDLVDWAVAKGDHPTTVEARTAVVEAVEKLERDAARYRWLRDRVFKSGGNLCVEILDGYDEFGMDFDAAIDAAMEATNGQGT